MSYYSQDTHRALHIFMVYATDRQLIVSPVSVHWMLPSMNIMSKRSFGDLFRFKERFAFLINHRINILISNLYKDSG